MKLLNDECLSPTLVTIARERGLDGSTCVQWLRMSGQTDHAVTRRAVDEGYILVTHNTADFLPLYQQEEVHVGLIALNSAAGMMSLALQQRLLLLALEIFQDQEHWNEVLEISVAADGTVTVDQYDLPLPWAPPISKSCTGPSRAGTQNRSGRPLRPGKRSGAEMAPSIDPSIADQSSPWSK